MPVVNVLETPTGTAHVFPILMVCKHIYYILVKSSQPKNAIWFFSDESDANIENDSEFIEEFSKEQN